MAEKSWHWEKCKLVSDDGSESLSLEKAFHKSGWDRGIRRACYWVLDPYNKKQDTLKK